MLLELYNSENYRTVEKARRDGATILCNADDGFIEGLKAACEIFGKAKNTIKFEIIHDKDNEQ